MRSKNQKPGIIYRNLSKHFQKQKILIQGNIINLKSRFFQTIAVACPGPIKKPHPVGIMPLR